MPAVCAHCSLSESVNHRRMDSLCSVWGHCSSQALLHTHTHTHAHRGLSALHTYTTPHTRACTQNSPKPKHIHPKRHAPNTTQHNRTKTNNLSFSAIKMLPTCKQSAHTMNKHTHTLLCIQAHKFCSKLLHLTLHQSLLHPEQ